MLFLVSANKCCDSQVGEQETSLRHFAAEHGVLEASAEHDVLKTSADYSVLNTVC